MDLPFANLTIEDLALTFVPHLGHRGVAHLLDIYGSAEMVYRVPEQDLIKRAELRQDIARSIVEKSGLREAERELEYCYKHEIDISCADDERYPHLLREIPDRPHILYAMGDIEALQSKHILSVVGTRRMTHYGEMACQRIISVLAEMFPDLVVVSGLAFGVDIAAHRAAMDAKVRTVAIVPTTLPDIVPSHHIPHAKDIMLRGGAIISELNSHTKHNGSFYIPRNRLIAGVAEGVLVVETPINGGSLSTAKAADAYARTLMAVPGRINDTMSFGTNNLIKSNMAQLVTSGSDVAYALGWDTPVSAPRHYHYEPRNLSDGEARIMACFEESSEGISVEGFVEMTGLPIHEVNALLLNMELSDLVRQIPGNIYVKY